jgi:5-(carboxyamino)imidazole ribonucleotide mutase
MESGSLKGLDSLLSTVQMPAGVPVGTLGIGKSGAVNAALLAVAILTVADPKLREKLRKFRADQEKTVRSQTLP